MKVEDAYWELKSFQQRAHAVCSVCRCTGEFVLDRCASASARGDILIAAGSLSFTLPSPSAPCVFSSLSSLSAFPSQPPHSRSSYARPEQDQTLIVQSKRLKGD